MFRFSGLLVAVALVLVAQEAQAQQHIAGGGRAQAESTGALWSVSVAVDVETNGIASGNVRLRSGDGVVYDIAIEEGFQLGATAILFGFGADGRAYDIEISEGTIRLFDFGYDSYPFLIESFVLVKGHIGL